MRILLILLSLLFTQPVFSQKTVIDSLLIELDKHTAPDTDRIDLLNELAYAYYTYDANKGIETSDKAIALAKKLNDPKRMAGSYSHKGLNYSVKGNDSLALVYYGFAIKTHMSINNELGVAKVLHNTGIIYSGMSEYEKALESHQRSFGIFKELKDTVRMSFAKNSIGVNYMYLSDYPKALECFFEVLPIFEKKNNTTGMAGCFTNIGIIYKKLSDYKKALEYHQKAFDLSKELGNYEAMANSLGNIGVVYDEMENHEAALKQYEEALKISKDIGYKRGVASNFTNIGTVYSNQKKYEAALDYFGQAAILFRELSDKNNLASVLNQTGNIYAAPKNNFKKAIGLQKEALALSIEIGAIDREDQSWENLSNTYQLQGDHKSALEAYKKHITLRDSILNDEKRQEILKKEMRLEAEKKEAIAEANHVAAIAREKTQRKTIVTIAILIIGGGILSFILFKRKNEAVARKNEAELKTQVVNTEMKALRAQMNPHFIFNSLNSISDYIRKNNTADADKYLVKFAKLMRLVLENSEKKEVSLTDDLQALELYMQLEELRTKNKFTYTITVDTDIDKDVTMIPPLILQPFVENSIWHGIAKKESSGKISVTVVKENDIINCIIEDDGIGRSKSFQSEKAINGESRKSFGMKITKDRIDILNKEKKSNSEILITDLKQGTKVEVRLPLILTS